MKNLKSVLGVAALAAVLGTTLASSNVLAWGDSAGGRRTYTKAEINSGVIDDKIILNSISDNETVGDERYFVQARADGTNDLWRTSDVTVEDGKTYVVRMYVHNNNRLGTDRIAENVKAQFTVPSDSAKSITVGGIVTSSNATPNKIWDEVVLKADTKFHLEYVAGSAHLGSNGKANGALSDALVNGGTLIGYDALDGKLPGCFQYGAFVSFKVKVVYDYDFTIAKNVRMAGDKTWLKQVTAKEGDTVEYMITYKNTSDVNELNVQLIEKLGSNQTYVPGSTILYNGNHKEGVKIQSDTLTTTGIAIGDYAPGAIAYVVFQVKVKNNNLGCGADNVLRSWTQGYIGQNNTMKQDYSDIIVHPGCPETPEKPPVEPENPPVTPETPPVLPQTGAASIAGTVLGVGSLATSAGAYLVSRKRF